MGVCMEGKWEGKRVCVRSRRGCVYGGEEGVGVWSEDVSECMEEKWV